jgi:hypothetical protein
MSLAMPQRWSDIRIAGNWPTTPACPASSNVAARERDSAELARLS